MPTVVAEGYKEVYREEMSKQINIIYENNSQESYMFTQQTLDMGRHINTEDSKYEQCDLLYGRAYFCENIGERQLVWYYEDYVFVLEGIINQEQMITIANSLTNH